jgi:hypothetical protein
MAAHFEIRQKDVDAARKVRCGPQGAFEGGGEPGADVGMG